MFLEVFSLNVSAEGKL